jgi:hypothetical protein
MGSPFVAESDLKLGRKDTSSGDFEKQGLNATRIK